MADPNAPDLAAEGSPDGAGRTSAGSGRVRFPLARWVLAPRTTWQARRLASDFGEGMDARTAWAMARLARHPDERGYAMAYLDDERRLRIELNSGAGLRLPGSLTARGLVVVVRGALRVQQKAFPR